MFTPCTGKYTQTHLSRLHRHFPSQIVKLFWWHNPPAIFPFVRRVICLWQAQLLTHARARTHTGMCVDANVDNKKCSDSSAMLNTFTMKLINTFCHPKGMRWIYIMYGAQDSWRIPFCHCSYNLSAPESPAAHLWISSLTPVWPRSWWENA